MASLAERLWGRAKPLADKLASIVAPASTISYSRADEIKKDSPSTDDNVLKPGMFDAPKTDPVKVDEGALVPQGIATKPLKTFDTPFIGTNYDPYDPDQTRPNPDGKGKAGIVMDDDMVATALKDDGLTGNLRLGTVIRIPSLGGKMFLVADTMNKRFNGMNKIDFVRKNKKKTPDPDVNKEFSDIEIVREGNGPEDARNFVESGEWDKMKSGVSSQQKLETTLPPLDEKRPLTQEQLNLEKVQFDAG